jgi:integrase
MKTDAKTESLWQKTRHANLVRNMSSGKYFARFRHNGKLIWRGLDTDVLSIAAQRLPDKIKAIKDEQALLASGSDPRITFEGASKIYQERVQASPDFKPRTKAYHNECLVALSKSWPDVKTKSIKDFTKTDCIEWRNNFASEFSPSVFNHTLGILRAIFEIGIEAGARRDNPAKAKEMKRLRETSKRLRLPEPQQFERFVKEIESGGSGFSKPCAELVQFLAFGGFRISEAKHITWADCDFARGKITLSGDPETGLKGRHAGEYREVPIIPDMRRLLERMRADRSEEPLTTKVTRVSECQKAMDRAAKNIGMTRITHHDLRHLFATRCIETGVDIPTVSRWLGHKDGGALALKVYGHLRDQHSVDMAGKVLFSAGKEAPTVIETAQQPAPVSSEIVVPTSEPEIKMAKTIKSASLPSNSIAKAKAKYSYPWWASDKALEIFWGQANEPIHILPKAKFLQSAKDAMGREVFESELTEPLALIEELQERVGADVIEKLMAKISQNQKQQAA